MKTIYNCHTHVFTNEIVPEKFLPLGITRFLSKRPVSRWLGKLLNRLNPRSSNDIFDRFASFMNIGNFKSQLDIFEFLKGFYPEETKFVVLSMDMEYMRAGRIHKDFTEQLNELSDIKKKYPDQFFPFVSVDPRRLNIADMVKKYIEEHNFQGIKLYPPLGYYPFDEKLYPVFEYAEANKIPIISHCSPPVVYYRGKITKEMLVHPKTGKKLERKNKQEFANYFTEPENYKYLLEDFPKLKICLAHFGGASEWEKYLATSWDKSMEKYWFSVILDLIKKYPNVYADVSHTMHDMSLYPLLRIILQDQKIRSRVLFGSDFYMLELTTPERSFSVNLRAYLGEEDYQQIAEINPRIFLKRLK
jgi:predicted TIM-barrel fold metal-dependent hydrolase